jgi:DNA-binding beta-propeller fold protein YncE
MKSADRGRNGFLLIVAITFLIAASPFGSVGVAREGPTRVAAQDRAVSPRHTPMYVLDWGTQGTDPDDLRAPVHVASTSSGYVYVSDQVEDRVQKFDDEGAYQTLWGSSGETEGQFESPWGLGVDSGGNVYVADDNNDRIQKFNGNGAFLVTWG